jgi:hypothetical protein
MGGVSVCLLGAGMKARMFTLAASVAVMLTASQVHAGMQTLLPRVTTAELLKICSVRDNGFALGLCVGFIKGVVDNRYSGWPPQPFRWKIDGYWAPVEACLTAELATALEGQVINDVFVWLGEQYELDPTIGPTPAYGMIPIAMAKLWPCP